MFVLLLVLAATCVGAVVRPLPSEAPFRVSWED